MSKRDKWERKTEKPQRVESFKEEEAQKIERVTA